MTDFDNLTLLTEDSASRQKYDMRFATTSTGPQFQISRNAWHKLDLAHRNLNILVNGEGEVVLEAVPEGQGTLLKKRNGKDGREFAKRPILKSSRLREALNLQGLENVNEFKLTPHTTKGKIYITISEWEDESGMTNAHVPMASGSGEVQLTLEDVEETAA